MGGPFQRTPRPLPLEMVTPRVDKRKPLRRLLRFAPTYGALAAPLRTFPLKKGSGDL